MSWNRNITSIGIELIADLIGAGETLTITRVACGSGSVPVDDLPSQIALTDFVKDLEITDISAANNTVTISAELNNADVAESKIISQMGIFAKVNDSSEILFMIYQTDAPFLMPSTDLVDDWAYSATFEIINNDDLNITVIRTSDIIEEIKNNLISHKGEQVDDENGSHGIRYTNTGELQVELPDMSWKTVADSNAPIYRIIKTFTLPMAEEDEWGNVPDEVLSGWENTIVIPSGERFRRRLAIPYSAFGLSSIGSTEVKNKLLNNLKVDINMNMVLDANDQYPLGISHSFDFVVGDSLYMNIGMLNPNPNNLNTDPYIACVISIVVSLNTDFYNQIQ